MQAGLKTHVVTGVQILALAALGGFLGYLGYFWMLKRGFFALVLPGGLMGLAAGLPRNRWIGWAFLVGLAALVLGFIADWKSNLKVTDLTTYLTNFQQIGGVPLLMIGVGAAIGFWGPFSRYRQAISRAARGVDSDRPQS